MPTREASPATSTNADLVRRAFEAVNRHDARAASELWSEDALWRVPEQTIRGPRQVAAWFEELFAAMPDVRFDVIAIAAEGPDVFVHWHMAGRHTGRLTGLDGTGRSIALDGMDHLVVRDGKIAANTIVFDQLESARQVGALPPLGSRADRLMTAMLNVRTKLVSSLRR
ncbi:MAG TPA: ester cyclase [Thermoleophilaceae bacterium]|jgi:steroid delta-isomerase-like uncharacterized protein